MLKLLLLLVTAAVMLHVGASQPLDVNVEVTVDGVKIPVGQYNPGARFGLWEGLG